MPWRESLEVDITIYSALDGSLYSSPATYPPPSEPIDKLEALSYYAKKFQQLRVDRAHGVAAHKLFCYSQCWICSRTARFTAM
jgi:hypothetical protein